MRALLHVVTADDSATKGTRRRTYALPQLSQRKPPRRFLPKRCVVKLSLGNVMSAPSACCSIAALLSRSTLTRSRCKWGEPFEHSPFKELFSLSPAVLPPATAAPITAAQQYRYPSKRVQRDILRHPSPDHGEGITAGVEVRRRPRMAATRWVCGAAPSFLSERR